MNSKINLLQLLKKIKLDWKSNLNYVYFLPLDKSFKMLKLLSLNTKSLFSLDNHEPFCIIDFSFSFNKCG